MKRIILVLVVLIALVYGGITWWLRSSLPTYEGQLHIEGLHHPVQVYYDAYGIPHIEAQNAEDAYRAFGYIHAQERLFQMELLRRAGSGRLAEIIGPDVVKVDKVFRTLDIPNYAKRSVEVLQASGNNAMIQELNAYLDGVNQFVHNGPTPPEFALLGIEKKDFTMYDMYCITGAMSFSFAQANKTEPILSLIEAQWGPDYLKDIQALPNLHYELNPSYLPSATTNDSAAQALLCLFNEAENALPFAPFMGSNSWAVAGSKTASGKPIFCNDTHIGYALPQTWFEAHIQCPEFELSGHFLGGIPYALVGRNPHHSWGLTMFENDDMDFFAEYINPNNPNEVWYKDHFEPLTYRDEVIKVKGQPDVNLHLAVTKHGTVANGAFQGFQSKTPISISWTYTQEENHTVDAFRGLNRATSFQEFQSFLPLIHGPGLNICYADDEGNIAWWGCGHLVKRNPNVNPFTIHDARNPYNEYQGYYTWNENPKSINPPWGFVSTANDQPEMMPDSMYYPGYYKPGYRAERIRKLLRANNQITAAYMQEVLNDATSDVDAQLLEDLIIIVRGCEHFQDVKDLMHWNGAYTPESASPVLFTRFLYNYLHDAMADELGEPVFQLFLETHHMQFAQTALFYSKDSKFWDNVKTPQHETREDILRQAFEKTVVALEKEEGAVAKWNWANVCHLELKHPLGVVKLLRPLLNREPLPVWGSNETILQSGFKLDSTGQYHVLFGSQMRIIADYGEHRYWNVTPSGQSGHPFSPYYLDQAELYRTRGFREEIEDWNVIRSYKKLTLQ